MIEAILFDLDDTLLGNQIETFIPGYFALLAQHARRYMKPERFLQELMYCTREMMARREADSPNRDFFWSLFADRTGLDPSELEPFFERFYREQFPQLASLTQVRPMAAELVRACFAEGFKVVIATNPIFPRTAIEERLAWAGIPVADFPFDLVTTYENMRSTKPHSSYYREILEKISCAPDAALMVGDNWNHDIIPAYTLGLFTYWIQPDGEEPPGIESATAYGSLEALYRRLTSGWLEELSAIEGVQND